MSQTFSRREVVNKENIGQLANVRRQPKIKSRTPFKEVELPLESPFRMIIEHDFEKHPQLVTPYIDTIIKHIREREEAELCINPDYMSAQRDINLRMRAILVDWLVDVNIKFRMQPQSFFMTIALIDRYLSVKEVARQKLQLVGIAALMIIGKYEEIYPPLLKDYVAVCDNAFRADEIVAMESEMLLTFNFDLNKTCSFVFLEYFRQKVLMSDQEFVFARFLLEISLLDTAYLRFNNFVLAAGAIYLVNKIFKKEAWSKVLEESTGVSESQAKNCAKELFATISRTESSSLNAIKRKFAEPEMFEVSKYKIEKVSSQTCISMSN